MSKEKKVFTYIVAITLGCMHSMNKKKKCPRYGRASRVSGAQDRPTQHVNRSGIPKDFIYHPNITSIRNQIGKRRK